MMMSNLTNISANPPQVVDDAAARLDGSHRADIESDARRGIQIDLRAEPAHLPPKGERKVVGFRIGLVDHDMIGARVDHCPHGFSVQGDGDNDVTAFDGIETDPTGPL